MDFERRILPYYMTYPGAGYGGMGVSYGMQPDGDALRDRDALRDLEYFRQLYPMQVRRYQTRIAEILDRMDYEGSVIYDEYPDRYTLERMAANITDILRREEREQHPEREGSEEKSELGGALVFVLLSNEVYKRRRGGRRGFFSFSG